MRLFAKIVIGACLLTLIGCASTRKAVPASRGNLSSVSYHGTGCFQDDLLVVEFMPDSQFAKVTLDNSQAVLVPVRHLRKIREISPDQLILRKDPGSDGMVFSSFVKMVFVYPDRKIVISEN